MDKKKITRYVVLLVVLIAASLSLPYIINTASDAVVARILKQADTGSDEAESETESESATETASETSSGTVSVTAAGQEDMAVDEDLDNETDDPAGQGTQVLQESQGSQEMLEAQQSSESKSSEEDAEQSEWLDQMQAYAESFSPEIIYDETTGTAETEFIGDRERQFLNAVGEYIYSLYDDLVTVTRIEIAEETRNDEDVCTCRIILYADDGNYEEFLCSYNKNYDFYGIYTVDNAETEDD